MVDSENFSLIFASDLAMVLLVRADDSGCAMPTVGLREIGPPRRPFLHHTFLTEADQAAERLGRDANFLWTAFGPTNVKIHRMTATMELGDVQVALDLGPRVDTHAMPVEQRVRHAIATARAYVRWNCVDEALGLLLSAE